MDTQRYTFSRGVGKSGLELVTPQKRNKNQGRVTRCKMNQDRCLSYRAPVLTNRRDKEGALFVNREKVGCQPCGGFFYTGPDISFPFGDGRLDAFDGPAFRLLMAPAHLVQELAHGKNSAPMEPQIRTSSNGQLNGVKSYLFRPLFQKNGVLFD